MRLLVLVLAAVALSGAPQALLAKAACPASSPSGCKPSKAAPRVGSGTPVNGSGAPVSGSGVPVNGSGAPINGAGVPLNGSGVPLNGGGAPINGAGAPVNGSGVSVNGAGVNGLPGPSCTVQASSAAAAAVICRPELRCKKTPTCQGQPRRWICRCI